MKPLTEKQAIERLAVFEARASAIRSLTAEQMKALAETVNEKREEFSLSAAEMKLTDTDRTWLCGAAAGLEDLLEEWRDLQTGEWRQWPEVAGAIKARAHAEEEASQDGG